MKKLNILRLDASSRQAHSISRRVGDDLLALITADQPVRVKTRDLMVETPAFIDESWIEVRGSDESLEILAPSDHLIDELQWADLLLITSPLYNFTIPAVLKAWIDLVARPGHTFRYTEQGPIGLLRHTKAILVVSSGGTDIGGGGDFASEYMAHVLDFMGIDLVATVGVIGMERMHGEALVSRKRLLRRQLNDAVVNFRRHSSTMGLPERRPS